MQLSFALYAGPVPRSPVRLRGARDVLSIAFLSSAWAHSVWCDPPDI